MRSGVTAGVPLQPEHLRACWPVIARPRSRLSFAFLSGFDLKEKATACGVHKIRGMVDLKHKRCEVVDCVRHRVYGAPGGKVSVWNGALSGVGVDTYYMFNNVRDAGLELVTVSFSTTHRTNGIIFKPVTLLWRHVSAMALTLIVALVDSASGRFR